jgi:hypothetical protein
MNPNPKQVDELTNAFAAISRGAAEGLSLRQAAALAEFSHRQLACWVRLADDGHAPWASWLGELCCTGARHRLAMLRDLKRLGELDSRALRDYLRELGAPSSLERELDHLRRSPTAEQDAFDEVRARQRRQNSRMLASAFSGGSRERA